MSKLVVWDQFARDLAAVHGEDFVQDFCASLLDERRAEEEVAFTAQQKVAAATQRLENCWMEGLGECHMRLDPEVYFHWVRREGRECWNDKSFVREFKRDNPEVIVQAKSRKATVTRA